MAVFAIELAGKDIEVEGDKVAIGTIKIGGFTETFHASLSYWGRENYINQWREALKRLQEGQNKSALITTMYDPKASNFIVWWLLYRVNGEVKVQNHILFLEFLKERFNEQNMYGFIPNREVRTDENEPISEWVLELSDIEAFLRA